MKKAMYSETARLEPRCKINMIRPISRTQCKNNCAQWNRKERKCKLGLP